jgi:phosphate transport system substrate-binding protein
MKTGKLMKAFALGPLLGALSLAAVPPGALAQTVKVDGSSTVFPITEAVAEEYQIQKRGKVRVTVGISGTGGGFKKFCRGETDVSDASRPISTSEMAACTAAGVKYIELPIAYDALTVVVNPKATWVDQVTVAELKKMWEPAAQGVVGKWNQVNGKWPNQPMKLFGPGTDSGTFDYFTEAVNGKAKSSRGDFTASEDDNVLVQGVEADVNALGYFGYAYYAANTTRMKALKIVNAQGKAVGPSEAAVLDGSYNPLSRPLFIYVNAASAKRPEVKEFVEFYLGKGADFVTEVKYVAFTPAAYQTALGHFHASRLGTVFGGVPAVGLKVEDLLAREAKL